MALAASAAMLGAVIPAAHAVQVNPTCDVKWSEDFEAADISEVLGADKLFSLQTASQSGMVSLTEGARNHNKYLTVKSEGDNTNGAMDVQINLNKGYLSGDLTVLKMKINCPNPHGSGFPTIRVIDNGNLLNGSKTSYALRFTSGDIRLYNVMASDYVSCSYNKEKWYDVEMVFDKANKKITTSVIGTDFVKESTTGGWSDNLQIKLQMALGTTLNIDDVKIIDGFYKTDYAMDIDFEHAEATSYDAKIVDECFSRLSTNCSATKTVYDAETDNTYANVSDTDAGAAKIVFTANTSSYTNLGRPTVMECDFLVDAGTSFNYVMRSNNGGGTATAFSVANGKFMLDGKEKKDIADNEWHSVRLSMVNDRANHFAVSVLLDGVYRGSITFGCDTTKGVRFDIRAASGSKGYSIDNYKIYKPLPAALKCDLNGRTDVGIDEAIVLHSNNEINYSGASRITVTANGQPVNFTTVPNVTERSEQICPEGGIQPGTEYVIQTVNMKDMFDQKYNTSATFTTQPLDPVEASVSYTIDGASVTDGKFTAGNMEFSLETVSNTSDGADLTAYVASYDESGTLLNVGLTNSKVDGQGTVSTTGNVTLSSNAQKVKIFIWDANQRPFAQVKELSPFHL